MRILITNNHIKNFAGSEINALQLAVALRDLKIETDVATFSYGQPMKDIYESNGITVKNLFDEEVFSEDYDVFWTHHFPTTNQIVFRCKQSFSKIIFSSLGSFASLEGPPIYHTDLNFILSNSQGNTDILKTQGVEESEIRYFPNYAPDYFFTESKNKQLNSLSRIAIISHHPPKELIDLTKIAVSKGIQVDLIGIENRQIFVGPELLKQYDLIISIGKTVQYCFALKIPVYCYDHFGGPGYINQNNLQTSEHFNFSGRGIDRSLNGESLYKDIISGYSTAVSNLEYLYEYCYNNFNLKTNLTNLLEYISSSNKIDLEKIRNRNQLSKRHHQTILRLVEVEEEAGKLNSFLRQCNENNQRLNQQVEENTSLIHKMDATIESLIVLNEKKEEEVSVYQNKINVIQSRLDDEIRRSARLNDLIKMQEQEMLHFVLSRSWRFTRPLRKIANMFRKNKND